LGLIKFTKKDLKKQKRGMLASPDDVKIPIDDNYVYENEYYLGISRFFRLFEYIFIVSTLLFAVGCVMAHPEIISYNNFVMFVKDFNTSAVETKRYTELLYDTDYTDEISLYREGAVVPGSDSVFVFTATGRLAYTAKHSFASPRLETGESSALLYDFSSDSYSIYNSYTEVYKGKSEHPIYSCTLSDSGRYAFTVRKSDGRFGVQLYSESNSRIAAFESDKYVIGASLDASGERLAVISLGVSEGERYTSFKVYNCNSGEALAEYTYKGVQPVTCSFLKNGGAYLLTDANIIFFEPSLSELKSTPVQSVSSVESDGARVALVCGKSVCLFSENGETVLSTRFSSSPRSVAILGDSLFVLAEGSVFRADLASSLITEKEVGTRYMKILATSDRHVILCGVSGASLVNMD